MNFYFRYIVWLSVRYLFSILIVYGWAVIPFVYVLSFFFKVPSSGYIFVSIFALLTGAPRRTGSDILLSRWVLRSTSGYATMVHGRGCNPHRRTTTFANLEITSLWRHWWRRNSETIRDRQKRRPPRAMKSAELSNGENRIALRQLLVIIWVQDGNCKKWLERILVLVRCTI